MASISIPQFAGMIPALDDHLIGETNAAEAVNALLYSGALKGLPKYTSIYRMARTTGGIAYRLPKNVDQPLSIEESHWVEFDDPNTDFVRAPIANDTFMRYYYASRAVPPRYNTRDRIIDGKDPYLLGVPRPSQVSVSASGGSASFGSRAYTTTYSTHFGEEGPNSEPFLINGRSDATYTVSVPGVESARDINGPDRFMGKINIYRTVVGAGGTAEYFLVGRLTCSTSAQNFTDNTTDAQLASRPIMESAGWTAPPDGLEGIVAMPNGFLAGFKDNELWLSEAYRPHAWPAAYTISLDYEIVGLGVTNQTLVILTQGTPMTASGVNPASVTTSRVASFEPCISRGSIVSTAEGVYYASPNGLILVNPGIAQNITEQAVGREEWLALITAKQVRAGKFGTTYFAFSGGLPQAIQRNAFQTDAFQQPSEDQRTSGFMVDPKNPNAGVSLLSANELITSVINDPLTGELLVTFGGNVHWLNQGIGSVQQPYRWKSKIFQSPEPVNFSAMKAYFYKPSRGNPNNDEIADNTLRQVFKPEEQYVLIRLFADGRLVATRELVKSGELIRLPSGYKAEFWQVEIEGAVDFKSIQLATSVKELSVV